MSRKPLCVAILWHMHQPDYGNVLTGEIYLPWTRFHAVKDYYDMGALVAQVPGTRVTINVVPSMIDQLCAYAQGSARETYAALTLKNAADLDEHEKLFLLRSFFQLTWKQMIFPYPRYKELLDRRGAPNADGDFDAALKRFSTQDFRDLQTWFNLSWCGNELRRHPAISGLLRKGRDFTEEDKSKLLALQAEFIGRILPLYRKLMEEHGVEISVTPYYHPILPLLMDNRSAREATPDIFMPASLFSFPGDAREHLERAWRRFQQVFGRPPQGMWPSEGAVSAPVSALARSLEFRWLASDEGVLQNSLRKMGQEGAGLTLVQRCRAWSHDDGPALFFRDHVLSDLVGFTYSRWDAKEAASDFLRRLREIYDALPDDGRHYVVPIILDGENAWEHYPENGAEFLTLLYRQLHEADFLRTVTFSEYLDLEPQPERLHHLVAGSWIYGCLATWLGHPEKNAAWEALTEARQEFARQEHLCADPDQKAKAFDELMIAEGSDWFWWYGDDHQTENAAEFDALFRAHLKNIYRFLGRTCPSVLDVPIKKADVRTQFRNPVHTITPTLDGKVTDYFEWLSAGFATPAGGGAMHRVTRHLEKVYFGYDMNNFYLRLDFTGGLAKLPPHVSVQLQFISPRDFRLTMNRAEGKWGCASYAPCHPDHKPTVAGARILEIGIPLQAIGVAGTEEVRFFVTVLEQGRELERFPSTRVLLVPVAPFGLNEQEWMV